MFDIGYYFDLFSTQLQKDDPKKYDPHAFQYIHQSGHYLTMIRTDLNSGLPVEIKWTRNPLIRKRAKGRETNEVDVNEDKINQLKQRLERPTDEGSPFRERFDSIH